MPRRPKMVGWYDIDRLASIAVRAGISTVFGEFSDKRETFSYSRPVKHEELDPVYDYTAEDMDGDFWVDYVADVGEGWQSTYAVARLLAEPTLKFDEVETKRGVILVMGGDQVYPTASPKEYEERLVAPYDAAANSIPHDPEAEFAPFGRPTSVFAIPGNHDWYDGLNSFLGLFCRRSEPGPFQSFRSGRMFGGRQTQQTRSYFAVKLRPKWWLWGVDNQLSGYIDKPQLEYFIHVAKEWMEPGSRIVICTAQPSWAYADPADPTPEFRNFSYVETLADRAEKGHKVCAVLTGDSHHYARYTEDDRQYITAGGGGAFAHPTHHLKSKKFDWAYPKPGCRDSMERSAYQRDFKIAKDSKTGKRAVFPSMFASWRMSWGNLFFAFGNWQYSLVVGILCAAFVWMLHSNAVRLDSNLTDFLSPERNTSFLECIWQYIRLVLISPFPPLLAGLAVAAYYSFSKFKTGLASMLAAISHGVAQVGLVALATCAMAYWLPTWFPLTPIRLIVLVGVVGGLISGTLMGLYLMLSLNLVGVHWNEAFSSLRIKDYKCFLRMRFSPDGKLTIYPIGLKRVPWGAKARLKPHLIETPIEIPGE